MPVPTYHLPSTIKDKKSSVMGDRVVARAHCNRENGDGYPPSIIRLNEKARKRNHSQVSTGG